MEDDGRNPQSMNVDITVVVMCEGKPGGKLEDQIYRQLETALTEIADPGRADDGVIAFNINCNWVDD